MTQWSNFFIAVAGASAGLTGLLFVGVSISLKNILSIRGLPDRALLSLVHLLHVLVLSILFLVPELMKQTLGAFLLCVSIPVWIIIGLLDLRSIRNKQRQYRRRYLLHVLINQVAAGCFVMSECMMLADKANGIYWIVPAIIVSMVKAVVDCWVLLVEINR